MRQSYCPNTCGFLSITEEQRHCGWTLFSTPYLFKTTFLNLSLHLHWRIPGGWKECDPKLQTPSREFQGRKGRIGRTSRCGIGHTVGMET